jgi:ankyrin repeat protein
VVAQLIRCGADVHARSEHGRTPLHRAVCVRWHYKGDAESEERQYRKASFLMVAGADVLARDNDGNTPLHFATTAPLSSLLLQNGASEESKNNKGKRPGPINERW